MFYQDSEEITITLALLNNKVILPLSCLTQLGFQFPRVREKASINTPWTKMLIFRVINEKPVCQLISWQDLPSRPENGKGGRLHEKTASRTGDT